jgi:hypothetical protein
VVNFPQGEKRVLEGEEDIEMNEKKMFYHILSDKEDCNPSCEFLDVN